MAAHLKFLHSSDWHLDQPITGLTEIPAHLKKGLADAPYRAAESIFSLALAEKVDFLLLAGDLVDLEKGGPRSAAFLLGQFERLNEKGIMVYWCGGSVDQPDRWPAAVDLPANVVVFPSTLIEQATYKRNGKVLATIVGAGFEPRKRNPADFRCDAEAPFPIALGHGEFDTAPMAAQNIRYWALGGRHKRAVLDKTTTTAVYPGTPQSRIPAESGSHSCTMVVVEESGRFKATEIDVDTVRWCPQKLSIAENASLDDLKTAIADRCQKLRSEFADGLTLVKWRIEPHGTFNARLRNGSWHTELVAWARLEFGQSQHAVWTAKIAIDPPETLPVEWHEEDTILGDYLRAIARYQGDASLSFVLPSFKAVDGDEDTWYSELSRVEAADRDQVLRRAAMAGVEYLARNEITEHA
jgi:DNA repair protein SbcD/Mre11